MGYASRLASLLPAFCTAWPAFAQDAPARYNLQTPVTSVAGQINDMHTLMLVICLVIFVGVFGVMFWAVFHHRKSKGAVAAHFHENTAVEIAWTVIPILILLGMAWPRSYDQGHWLPVAVGLRLSAGRGGRDPLPVGLVYAARSNRRRRAQG